MSNSPILLIALLVYIRLDVSFKLTMENNVQRQPIITFLSLFPCLFIYKLHPYILVRPVCQGLQYTP